jgi:hypothetical protein
MSASGEDIGENIKLVTCAIIKDNTTQDERRIVVFEYRLPVPLVPMRSAFYQSSGTSITTRQIFKDTYFPFYGSTVSPLNKMQNTLIKATQHTQSGSIAPILQQWQHALRERFSFIKVYDEIFKRFTHFHELRISALIGSSWWSNGGTSGLIRDFILSHVWDGEKFIEVDVVSKIDVNMCFNNEKHILEDDNSEINTFLRENSVDVIHSRRNGRSYRTDNTRKTRRSYRTDNTRKTRRSRSRDRGSSSESDSSHESAVSDNQQPKSIMVRTFAIGPRHTSKGGANTRRNKNKSKRGKRSSTRRRRRSRSH